MIFSSPIVLLDGCVACGTDSHRVVVSFVVAISLLGLGSYRFR